MKTRNLPVSPAAWLVLALLLGACPATKASDAQVGQPAPPLKLAEILQAPADADASWDKLRGKVVVVDFWATWCGPCVASLPHWNDLALQFRDKPVVFIAVTDENKDIVTSFLKRRTISSWVGLEGITQSTRDRYGIRGIPTTVLVNQEGIVVARTHPVQLQSTNIQEVLDTRGSSLPAPAPAAPAETPGNTVSVAKQPPLFEVSIRRSGARIPNHGFDCWSFTQDRRDLHGEYAPLKSALCQFFRVRPSLLEVRATLPEVDYDFALHVNAGAQREVEELFSAALRQTFGLSARWISRERDVLLLTIAHTNAPGLQPYDPAVPPSGGSAGSGKLMYSPARIEELLPFLEDCLGKLTVDETGKTNLYNIRLKWKMSPAELLPSRFEREVQRAVSQVPPTDAWKQLPEPNRSVAAAIKGELPAADLAKLDPELQADIELMRRELAKPDSQRFRPDPDAICAALREQLGLQLTPARRAVPVLVVEPL